MFVFFVCRASNAVIHFPLNAPFNSSAYLIYIGLLLHYWQYLVECHHCSYHASLKGLLVRRGWYSATPMTKKRSCDSADSSDSCMLLADIISPFVPNGGQPSHRKMGKPCPAPLDLHLPSNRKAQRNAVDDRDRVETTRNCRGQ